MENRLTPLEKIEQSHFRAALLRATITALQDLLEVSQDLSILPSDPEVEKELLLTDRAIVALANTLEKQFGICA